MNNVIILLTHVWNDNIKDLHDKLSDCHKTLILFDETSSFYNDELRSLDNIRFFNDDKIKETGMEKYYPMPKNKDIKEGELMFNNFSAILTIKDELLQYDYIYIWEYDVRFNGDYHTLFDVMSNLNDDMLSTNLTTYIYNANDEWWPHLNAGVFYKSLNKEKTMLDIPKEYWVCSIMPFCRFSKKAMKLLIRELPKYPEYFEILVPTLCFFNYLKISDCIFIDNEHVTNKQTFDWRPQQGPMNQINKIYHAIK